MVYLVGITSLRELNLFSILSMLHFWLHYLVTKWMLRIHLEGTVDQISTQLISSVHLLRPRTMSLLSAQNVVHQKASETLPRS
ncbi:hypothetical protein ACET3Z_010936 [Daucus carota]